MNACLFDDHILPETRREDIGVKTRGAGEGIVAGQAADNVRLRGAVKGVRLWRASYIQFEVAQVHETTGLEFDGVNAAQDPAAVIVEALNAHAVIAGADDQVFGVSRGQLKAQVVSGDAALETDTAAISAACLFDDHILPETRRKDVGVIARGAGQGIVAGQAADGVRLRGAVKGVCLWRASYIHSHLISCCERHGGRCLFLYIRLRLMSILCYPPPRDVNLPEGKKSKKTAIRYGRGVSAGFSITGKQELRL